MSKYKINIIHDDEQLSELYCNDFSRDGDYLIITHGEGDCSILCLRHVALVRIRKCNKEAE